MTIKYIYITYLTHRDPRNRKVARPSLGRRGREALQVFGSGAIGNPFSSRTDYWWMVREGDLGGDDRGQRLTPAMEQYRSFKEQYPDAILFFHIGDFYETFGADAELVSRELDIALTSRSRDRSGNRIPLAGGAPRRRRGLYRPRLVGKGYRVAVCDQVEEPGRGPGIVKRAVVRVVTPGTAIDPGMVEPLGSRYLVGVWPDAKKNQVGLAFLETSTGEFFLSICRDVGRPRGFQVRDSSGTGRPKP